MTPGSVVTLYPTAVRYTVAALYCTAAQAPKWSEEWARLITEDGREAFWKVQQLMPVETGHNGGSYPTAS